MAVRTYSGPGEAREVRLQQMRAWRAAQRHQRFLQQLAAGLITEEEPAIPKYRPTNLHCPGTIALALLYGDRSGR